MLTTLIDSFAKPLKNLDKITKAIQCERLILYER